MLEMPASVDFERNGFPSRHCEVIPESEEMDTDSSDCEHEEEEEEEEEEEQEEEEEEEEEKPRALWRTGSVGRTGLRGRTGADRRSGWRVLINHLVTFPAPDRPHHHDQERPSKAPPGRKGPTSNPCHG